MRSRHERAGVCLGFNDAAGETYLPAPFQQSILSRAELIINSPEEPLGSVCRARCGPAEWARSPAGVICWPAESICFCIFNPGKMSPSGELSPERACL